MPNSADLLSSAIQANTTLEYTFIRINAAITATSNNSIILFYPSGFYLIKNKLKIFKFI